MKTLRSQLHGLQEKIRNRGGKVPKARGTIERQLGDCQAEVERLRLNEQGDGYRNTQKKIQESRRTQTQLLYESMGLSPEQARIAAKVERGVQRNDVNAVFNAALALGLSEAAARVFADPKINPHPIANTPLDQVLDNEKKPFRNHDR